VGKLPLNFRIFLVSFVKRKINPKSSFSGFRSEVNRREQYVERIFQTDNLHNKWSKRSGHFHTKTLSSLPERMKDSYSCSVKVHTDAFLTVDMWDTLIGRFRPAEAVKRSAAMYLSLEDWQIKDYNGDRISAEIIHDSRLNLESDFSLRGIEPSIFQVYEKLNELIFKANGMDLIHKAISFELNEEISQTYNVREIAKIIQEHNYVVISDHFYDSSALSFILEHHGFAPNAVISSSQVGFSKRNNGELFKELNFQANVNWVHLGDNQFSDVQYPRELGASSALVVKNNTLPWHRNDLEFNSLMNSLPDFFSLDSFNRVHCLVSQLSHCLVTFSIEVALRSKKSKILYLSREGRTLYDFHEANLLHYKKLGLEKVEPVYFPASRTSLFMASYAGSLASIRLGLKTLSIQYPVMDLNTFCSTLGLNDHLKSIVLKESNHKKDSALQLFDNLPIFIATEISNYLSEQKLLIKNHLESRGITSGNVIYCDLGWRGTLQDSIHRILGEQGIAEGTYLANWTPLVKNTKSKKLGLLNVRFSNDDVESLTEFPGPIERIFTTLDKSVSQYNLSKSGAFEVIYGKKEFCIQERLDSYSMNFSFIAEAVGRQMLALGIFGFETASIAKDLIERFYSQPSFFEAATWFEEIHGEAFGSGDDTHYKIISPNDSWSNPGSKKDIFRALTLSRWDSGYEAWLQTDSSKGEV
jgi:hypothetical protein